MHKVFKIAKVIDSYTVVIAGGYSDGIKENQRFLIYSLDGEEIFHPDTNKLLGNLEVTKGTGKVIFLQENTATIKSDSYYEFTLMDSATTIYGLAGSKPKVGDMILSTFKSPKVGDLIKPI